MLTFRFAKQEDYYLYFSWANDDLVRQQSFNKEPIKLKEHELWFKNKISSKNTFLYLFLFNEIPIGQVRIEKDVNNTTSTIGISIAKEFRGKSFGVQMLNIAVNNFFENNPTFVIYAYIKIDNISSIKTFKSACFINQIVVDINLDKAIRLEKMN